MQPNMFDGWIVCRDDARGEVMEPHFTYCDSNRFCTMIYHMRVIENDLDRAVWILS